MSRVLCHLIPSKFVRQELQKEFNANRFWLNHYEFVDFTVFEYGQRTQYLQWRVFSILITLLLTAHVFFPGIQVLHSAEPYSKFIYMHFWLSVLLLIHSVLELFILTWTYYRTPSPVLVRIHHTPWHFKLIWLMYNILYPNILSCNVMYYAVIKDIEVHMGESRLFVALLASFAGIHISVTAVPSRMAHIIQPLLFNGLHIAFTYVYQMNGLTNHMGQNYVYLEIDWLNSRTSAVCCSLVWLLVTSCCHILIVCCCWYRRLVYRAKRTKSTKPIYGFSPEDYCPITDSTEHFNSQFEIPGDDAGKVPADVADPVTKVPKLKTQKLYSPHMSYRLVPVPRSMVNNCISEMTLGQSDLLKTTPGARMTRVGRLRKGFKKTRSRIACKDKADSRYCSKKQKSHGGVASGACRSTSRLKRRVSGPKKRSLGKARDMMRKRDKCPGWKAQHSAKAISETAVNSVVHIGGNDSRLDSSEGWGKLLKQANEDMKGNTSPIQMGIQSEMVEDNSPSMQFLSDEYLDYLSAKISNQWEDSSMVHECAESVHGGFSAE